MQSALGRLILGEVKLTRCMFAWQGVNIAGFDFGADIQV
jgi:hypothetical protein